MNVKLALVILATINLKVGVCQQLGTAAVIDKFVAEIDSITTEGTNIAEYIHRLYADDGGKLWLNNHFVVDTAKRILYKCIYDRIDFEQVTFYYREKKIIKTIIIDSSFKGEYYFDSDSIILSREQGVWKQPVLWNNKDFIDGGKEYLYFFKGICDMLDKKQ